MNGSVRRDEPPLDAADDRTETRVAGSAAVKPGRTSRMVRGGLHAIFCSDDQGRARVLWLILLPVVGTYAALVVADVALGAFPLPAHAFLVNAAAVGAAIALVLISRRFLGARRGLAGYGLTVGHRWRSDALAGLAVGFAGAGLPYLIGLGAGWVEIVAVLDRGAIAQQGWFALWSGIMLLVLANLCVALWEELILRGVFLCNAADGLRRWLSPRLAVAGAIVVSSAVFGIAHYAQATQAILLLTWVLAGVVLAAIYMFSGSLALPIGVHAAINLTGQVVFVRTDLPHAEDLSALTRISVDPSLSLLDYGALLEGAMFLSVGLLALLFIRRSRGALRVNLAALQLGDSEPPEPPEISSPSS